MANMNAAVLYQMIQMMEEQIGNGVKIEITRRGNDLVIHSFFFSIELHDTRYIHNAQELTAKEGEQALKVAIEQIKIAYDTWK